MFKYSNDERKEQKESKSKFDSCCDYRGYFLEKPFFSQVAC